MLTHFVLGSAVSGGVLVFAAPLAFASLLSLRYPDPRVAAMNHRQDEFAAGEVDAAVAEPSRSSVVGPERLQSLRAARSRKAEASSHDVVQAA
jgi:hypothetical protein